MADADFSVKQVKSYVMKYNFKAYALAHDPQEDQAAADDWFSDAVDSDVADDNCYGGNQGN